MGNWLDLLSAASARRNGIRIKCSRPWCQDTTHMAQCGYYSHFAVVADFLNPDSECIVLMTLTEAVPSGSPHLSLTSYANLDDAAGRDLDLTAESAIALAQILEMLPPAEITRLAKEIRAAAAVVNPTIAEETS